MKNETRQIRAAHKAIRKVQLGHFYQATRTIKTLKAGLEAAEKAGYAGDVRIIKRNLKAISK